MSLVANINKTLTLHVLFRQKRCRFSSIIDFKRAKTHAWITWIVWIIVSVMPTYDENAYNLNHQHSERLSKLWVGHIHKFYGKEVTKLVIGVLLMFIQLLQCYEKPLNENMIWFYVMRANKLGLSHSQGRALFSTYLLLSILRKFVCKLNTLS